MTALTLYQLAGQYRELEALGESEDIPPEVMRDTLDALGGELQDKAIAVAHFVRNLESAADSIEDAYEAMFSRAQRLRDRADSIREYLLFHLQATQLLRIDSEFFTLTVRTNPPAVVVDDESAVPAEFKTQPPPPPMRVDRARIAAALKAGESVSGCRLLSKQRLEIKV